MNQLWFVFSPGGTTENSPRLQPWVGRANTIKPRRGERKGTDHPTPSLAFRQRFFRLCGAFRHGSIHSHGLISGRRSLVAKTQCIKQLTNECIGLTSFAYVPNRIVVLFSGSPGRNRQGDWFLLGPGETADDSLSFQRGKEIFVVTKPTRLTKPRVPKEVCMVRDRVR